MSIGLLVISFLLVLGPLILLHELGHFLVAKRAGIRALEFGMGYPPRAARLWRGKGYMIVSGRRIEIPRNFNLPFDWQIGINKRAEASADEIKGRLVLRSIELADGEDKSFQPEQLPAPIPQAIVDGHAVEVSRNAVAVRPAPKPAVKAAPRRGAIALSGAIEEIDPGTEYTLNWLPLGGFVRMWGEEGATGKGSFTDAPKRWRTATLLAGPGMNILVALIVFTGMYMIGYPEFPNVPAKITDVMTGSPAASAGLQVNDTIIALDDTPIKDASDVRPYIEEHGGQPVKVTVMRAGQHIVLSITPRTAAQTPPNQGRMGIVLSTAPLSNYTLVKYPPGEAVARAFGDISNTLRQIVTLPTRLLSGVIAPSEAQVVGPVGISEYAAAAVEKTTTTGEWFWFLNLFAAISLALAITNLLPLPALDGGRLLFVILEAIRHKRIAPEREAIVHLIGMAVLLALMALITFQDISRLISN